MHIYQVSFQTRPGDFEHRMSCLIDVSNGMFVVEELHYLPDRVEMRIASQKSTEHIRTLLIHSLEEAFPMVDKLIKVEYKGDDE